MYISRKTLALVRSEHERVKRRLAEQRGIIRQAIESGSGTHDNAMYDAALQDQHVLAERESRLRQYLTYRTIDDLDIRGETVSLGTSITLRRSDTGDILRFAILGPPDAELRSNESVISYLSPLAKQLIGTSIGDVVTVQVPSGDYEAEVVAVDKAVGS